MTKKTKARATGHPPVRISDGPEGFIRCHGATKRAYVLGEPDPDTGRRGRLYVGIWDPVKALPQATLDAAKVRLQELRAGAVKAAAVLTVEGLTKLHLAFLESEGTSYKETHHWRTAYRFLNREFGTLAASKFTPLALEVVRDTMASEQRPRNSAAKRLAEPVESAQPVPEFESRYCKLTVNAAVKRIKSLYRWAWRRSHVEAHVANGIQIAEILKKGRRKDVRGSRKVGAVSRADVEATCAVLPNTLAAMVRLQLECGCRPGEIVQVRGCDIDRSDPSCWIFSPLRHKGEWRDEPREIYFGPKGQAILNPFLADRLPVVHCFQPAEALRERMEAATRARKTNSKWGGQVRPERRARRLAACRESFSADTYRQAVGRAAEDAGVEHWHPHQLRHTRATELRTKYGVEAAAIHNGNRDPKVVDQVYAWENREQAMKLAAEAS